MILPTKHVGIDRTLLGLGANILDTLSSPMTMSALWNNIRGQRAMDDSKPPVDYKWFVLSLDLLFIIGVVEFENGLLVKRKLK